MKNSMVKVLKYCMSIFVFSFLISVFVPSTSHAESLTGQVIVKGTMQPGSYIEAEVINSNNTGELSYQWVFDFGMLNITYERYHQKKYQLWETDFDHFITCVVKSSKQTGQIQSNTFYLTKGGAFDAGGTVTPPTVQLPSAPSGVSVVAGDGKATLSWNATSGATSYGVYLYDRNSNIIDLRGTTTAQGFTVSNLTNDTTYEFIVRSKNEAGWSDWNKDQAISVTPMASFAITKQPKSCSVTEGSNVEFSVSATGNGLSYQWQCSTDGGRTWINSDASGNKSATLSLVTKYNMNNMQFRCVVKDSSNASINSNVAMLAVGMAYPYFTTNPSDVTVTAGNTAKFSVAVYGVDLAYQWQKSTDGGQTWVNSTSAGATTANLSINTTLNDNNTKVRCVVTAANGTKLTSNAATLTVSLAMPVVTSVSNTANGVEVKWNAVNGAAQYRVFYKTANGEWTGAGNTTGTSKVVSGLTSGTTYSFSVRCVSADGNTYTSAYDTTGKSIVYQPVITMVASPEITSLTNTSTGVQVKWNAVNGAAQYRVFYRIGSGAWTTVGSTTGTSKGVTGLTSGNTYTFLVRCLSADGKAYTSEYDVTKGKNITYIAQPAVSSVSNTSNGVEVRWNAVAGASQYRVFYKAANGAWTGFANTTGTSKVVTGLTSGTTYSFTVRCVSADGKTYTSTYDTTGKSIKYQPVAGTMYASPEILSLNNTTDGVEVKWDAIAGAAQYRIFYRVGSGAWTTVGAITGTSKVVSGLSSGTTYTFLVRCLSADGKAYTSEYDATKGKSITYKPTTLATPVVSSLSNTATGVQVKWNAVAGASQYRVFYKVGNGSWVGYGNTTGTSMVVTGLTKGTTYSFTVRCLSADGKSYTSNYDTTGKAISVQ